MAFSRRFLLATLVFLLALFVHNIDCKRNQPSRTVTLKPDYTPNAWIYPGYVKRGIHIKFSDSGDWSDLWALMSKKGFYSMGTLCVRGAFLLYREPNFKVSNPNAFSIISGRKCPQAVPVHTRSIQLIGSMAGFNQDSITFFEKPSFGSLAYPTTVSAKGLFFKSMEGTRSAIVSGKTGWTLQLSVGDPVCVIPDWDPKEAHPICLIRDFSLLLLDVEDNTKTILLSATKGCKEDFPEASIYKLQDCRYWSKSLAKRIGGALNKIANNVKPNRRALGRTIQDEAICSNPEKSKRLFQLYKMVITNSAESPLIVEWPKLGKHVWKLELLELMFTVFTSVVPNSLVPTRFINHVRELFIDKLAEAWNKMGMNETDPLGEKEYFNLIKMTEHCAMSIGESSDRITEQFVSQLDLISSEEDFYKQQDPEFVRQPELDVVTEIGWMVGHMTGFLCHRKFMSKAPYWALFFQAFQSMFMEPLKEEWKTPTIGLDIIFGGIDYELEYKKLALFTSIARHLAGDLDPLARPGNLSPSMTKSPQSASVAGSVTSTSAEVTN